MADSKIVTYDLCKPGKDYASLIKAIESFPFAQKVCLSTWVIKTPLDCTAVRDLLLRHMDNNDRLFVAALTGEAAWHKAICGTENIKGKF